jgi:5-methylcytosine-specific restriction enzyme A
MAWLMDKPCPACQIVKIPAHDRLCANCKSETSKRYDKQRGSARSRGYTRRWAAVARAHLMKYPECVMCKRPAEEVDHIKPHKGDQRLFWDPKNRQSLCKICHSRKTATEDGRWETKAIG